jgi:hypothetical protein
MCRKKFYPLRGNEELWNKLLGIEDFTVKSLPYIGPQPIKDGFQYPARRYRVPPAPGPSPAGLGFPLFPLRDEILHLFPQLPRQLL